MALIAALGAALDYIAAQADGDLARGRVLLVENAETCAAMTRAAVPALGMRLFAPTAPAAAVTAVLPPEGVDSGVIVKELKSRFGAVITNGQGEMKGQIFRIAHLGFFDPLDTLALLGALEQVTADTLRVKGFAAGRCADGGAERIRATYSCCEEFRICRCFSRYAGDCRRCAVAFPYQPRSQKRDLGHPVPRI